MLHAVAALQSPLTAPARRCVAASSSAAFPSSAEAEISASPVQSLARAVEVAPSTGILTYLRVVVVVQVIEAASPDRENCVCDHLDHSI